MRWAAKSDANQQPIVDHLRANDWTVCVTSRVGQGFPDLVCARMGFTALLEAKVGKRDLNPDQEIFHKSWPGVILTSNSPQDALSKLNAALVRSGACRLEDVNGL